jgi:hypothetical protein
MKTEFCSYERALALKELGFDEMCFKTYTEDKELIFYCTGKYYYPAPLKQQVFRWFREKHELHHMIIIDSDTNTFDAGLFGELVTPFLEEDTIFHTYEEAENACIDKLISIVKQQDND